MDNITYMSTPVRVGALPLSALNPAPSLTRSSSPQVDHLFSTLVDATFDLIDEMGQSMSLLVYLHVPHDDQPLLFMREPTLDLLSPTDTFRLMHTVTMLSNGRKPAAAFRHGQLSGHYNRTSGAESDGLFVFGPIQTADTSARIMAISRAFARVLHQFHLEDDGAAIEDRPVIHVETVGEQTEATITIQGEHTTLRGSATDRNAEHAVARAVVETCAPGYRFDETRRIDVGTRSAVLVVARDATQTLRLGLAISEGDILHTVALAARRAVGQTC